MNSYINYLKSMKYSGNVVASSFVGQSFCFSVFKLVTKNQSVTITTHSSGLACPKVVLDATGSKTI
jgi:hypothetical protein